MTQTADVVIAGAGIIGMSIAMQIARRSNLRVIVVDKGDGPGEGSTGASSAVCRFKYTRPETVSLARDGIAAYQNWSAFLRISDPVARFHRHGVVWLNGGTEEEVARLAGLGIRTECLDDDDVQARFPAVNPCRLAPDFENGEPHDCTSGGQHLLEVDAGYVDPMDALGDLITAARAAGVTVRFRTELTGVRRSGDKVTGVTLDGTERIDAPIVVNAAGPWCMSLFQLAGVDHPWPLVPTRIQIVHVARPTTVEGLLPVCVDPAGGIYFRTQNRGQQILIGSVLEVDEQEAVRDPDAYSRYADDEFINRTLHALQHRLPGLADFRQVRGYSGLYTMNRSDVHPVVGRTSLEGFYVANGCSGHGFKLAPAIGSLIARLIVGDASEFDTSVDPAFLSFERSPIPIRSRSVLA
jgi:glycine/D-amino acid oxidase-like deaminating enzyme